ncbi:hypothetical protein BDY24DRAFT_264749 [Mrakia frigida]|uniref:complex I NDUFA9 subunit family protein n=1 Tax=Mrakia frigida TaxID=29902 RepID=UPI003FCBFA12
MSSLPPSSFSAIPAKNKTVIIGAGFLASYIAKTLVASSSRNTVLLASRNPEKLHSKLSHLGNQILPAKANVDISKGEGLDELLKGASTVVNLVGIMHGSPALFDSVQWKGAQNVAQASEKAGAKLIHISAIGADPTSPIDYWRTKGLGEQAVLEFSPKATIIRPSLVFGPGDGFFTRFANLAKYLPFLPVFGGGTSLFQPVYAGDLAKAIEIISRSSSDPEVAAMVDGKICEAGGPTVYTYKELMQLTLKYAEKSRPILSLPYQVGLLQGLVLERLPENLFTVTRSQVNQLRSNNIVADPLPSTTHVSFAKVLAAFPPPAVPSSAPPPKAKTEAEVLTPAEEILPEYLGSGAEDGGVLERVKGGKRMHGGKGFQG